MEARAVPERVLMLVSIDTEEDNWNRSRDRITCRNIRALEYQAAFFARLGIRPTYFTSYQVACDRAAAGVLKDVGPLGEIGAHLHPWNTPPLDEAFVPRNSMLKNLPASLQLAKLQTLTATLQRTFGVRPRAFRAGRYGLGSGTVAALERCGYHTDSSVTPFVSWEDCDDGPSFVGAPLDVYRLDSRGDVTKPAERGGIVEVPLSCGFNRAPFPVWGRVRRALDARPLRALRLAGVAARTGVCKRIVLSPELATAAEMLTLSRRLLERGIRHLHLTWHSPSLVPGLSPFAHTTRDVRNLYDSVEQYLDGLTRYASFRFATVSEAATLLTQTSLPEVVAC
jgi:hypothetical protein